MPADVLLHCLSPILWLILALWFLDEEPIKRIISCWVIMLVICMFLSFMMVYRISSMLGSVVKWSEVLFYGWFLSGLFSLFQMFKNFLFLWIKKIVIWPDVLVRNGFVQLLCFVILFVLMIPFFLAMTSIHRVKVGNSNDPRTALGLDYEDVSWRTGDGLNIKGWYVPNRSDKAVLIAHGLGVNRSNFMAVVELWHQLGFNVLIFDFRGHGDSDGRTITFGYQERLDVIGGWDYLTRIKKIDPSKIIGYGVSFGGAAMINVASQNIRFQKLIIDSSYASIDDMAMNIVERQPIVPSFLSSIFKEIGLFFVELELGFDIREKSPENMIAALTGTPVLFIHGRGDKLINYFQTMRLFSRAGQPKEIYIMDTSGHFGTVNDRSYKAIIQSFLDS